MLRPTGPSDTDGVKILFIGRPGSGKTHAIKYLLFCKRHIIPVGVVFAGTESSNSFWSSMFPKTFIFNSVDVGQVENVVARQAHHMAQMPNGWVAMVFDDVADDKQSLNAPIFKTILKNGRHFRIFFIIVCQYMTDLPPALRNNADFVFIYREPSITTRKKLFDNFGGVCGDFSTFSHIMDAITGDHTCMVIDNANQCNSIEDTIFWFKAPADLPADFKFGCADYWRYHYMRNNG